MSVSEEIDIENRSPSDYGKIEVKDETNCDNEEIMKDDNENTAKLEEFQRLKTRSQTLQMILLQKEKEAKEYTKKLKEMKQTLNEAYANERANKKQLMVDITLNNEKKIMNQKIIEKTNRQQFLDKEIENFNRLRSDENPNFINKYYADWNRLSNENHILETYVRSETYRSSLDMIQALKQTAEQISIEIEKSNNLKQEYDLEKAQFEQVLQKLRGENRKIKAENDALAEELERRKQPNINECKICEHILMQYLVRCIIILLQNYGL